MGPQIPEIGGDPQLGFDRVPPKLFEKRSVVSVGDKQEGFLMATLLPMSSRYWSVWVKAPWNWSM